MTCPPPPPSPDDNDHHHSNHHHHDASVGFLTLQNGCGRRKVRFQKMVCSSCQASRNKRIQCLGGVEQSSLIVVQPEQKTPQSFHVHSRHFGDIWMNCTEEEMERLRLQALNIIFQNAQCRAILVEMAKQSPPAGQWTYWNEMLRLMDQDDIN